MYDGWASVEELFQSITGAPTTTSAPLSFSSPGGLCKFFLFIVSLPPPDHIIDTSMRKQNTQDVTDTVLSSLLNGMFSVDNVL